MKVHLSILLVLIVGVISGAPRLCATESNQPPAAPAIPQPTGAPGTAAVARVVFTPPKRLAPPENERVDHTSRGSGISLTCLNVLAPDSTALTIQEQPSLLWYQSPADVPFELSILVDNEVHPLLRVRLPNARNFGIQRINLADYNVRLSPNIEYEWVVALVAYPVNRSKDVVANGWIERVESSQSLRSKLATTPKEGWTYVYAEEGIWVDALAALSDLIKARPTDKDLHENLAALLEQAGLTNAANYAASMTLKE